MPFLQTQLVEALESIIANKNEFDKKFTRILKTTLSKDKSLSPQESELLCNHVYKTLQSTISALKGKNILDDDYKKVFDLIITLIESQPWITTLTDRNEKLRDLANHCLQQITMNVEMTLKTKSR